MDCVCGATATAIARLVGDKVGWPRRGVEWRLAVGSGSLPSSCMHAQGRTEPIGVSKAGCLGCSGACQVGLGLVCFGWVALMSLLRSDGRFDVAVFRGSVPVPVPGLVPCGRLSVSVPVF